MILGYSLHVLTTNSASLIGMAELASLVQRLEVAVGRLEAISSTGGAGGSAAGGGIANETPSHSLLLI